MLCLVAVFFVRGAGLEEALAVEAGAQVAVVLALLLAVALVLVAALFVPSPSCRGIVPCRHTLAFAVVLAQQAACFPFSGLGAFVAVVAE